MEPPFSKMLTPNGMPTNYKIYRENGTIFVQNTRQISTELKKRLETSEGEIFLCNLPHSMTVHELAKVLLQVNEFYILRFKVNYAGLSRTYAYMQFMEPEHMLADINSLLRIFKAHNWSMHAFKSKNLTTIVLRDVNANLSPFEVYEKLCKFLKYKKFRVLEYTQNCFVYHIEFASNESAVIGKRELTKHKYLFGKETHFFWLDIKMNDIVPRNSNCCHTFDHATLESVTELQKIFEKGCNCFKF